VRCEASSRARGSAEEVVRSGRRRNAIEAADMKMNVRKDGGTVIEFGFVCSHHRCFILWWVPPSDVTMIVWGKHARAST
jgi:hypothetical protein